MDKILNNEWISIPNEKGEFGEPEFIQGICMLTTNYDQIKIMKNLSSNIIIQKTKKLVLSEISQQIGTK
jgi:hypothetical protein